MWCHVNCLEVALVIVDATNPRLGGDVHVLLDEFFFLRQVERQLLRLLAGADWPFWNWCTIAWSVGFPAPIESPFISPAQFEAAVFAVQAVRGGSKFMQRITHIRAIQRFLLIFCQRRHFTIAPGLVFD